jgi:predicted RNase H-like HicB family nuclease
MKLKLILTPSEEGGYTVYVPALPGCISESDTGMRLSLISGKQ